ncbi:MAG TPA: ABC transporter permease, partial [Reyranella sp.]|nr:ABC transporter permease [Reyranella sp.]
MTVAASPRRLAWGRLMRHSLAQVSLAFLAVLFVLSLAAPLIAQLRGIDPSTTDLFRRLEAPSAEHWLGTDDLGRDLFQRLLDGGRVSLLVGLSGALLSAILGAIVGVLAGYLGGRLDSVLMRLTDGVIALPLLIVLAAIDPRKIGIPADISQSETFSLYRIVVIVALTGWTTVARLVRAETLSLKARDFTRAAQALGAVPLRIMFRHILPN